MNPGLYARRASGWQDALPPGDGRDREDDYYPVLDNDDGRDGGIIELHFNW